MSQHRKARGMRTQLLVADYLKDHGWPHATSAGAGRAGVDVLNTPDIAVEVKARTDLSPLAWVRQAEKEADGRLPFAVFRPNGMGEHPGQFLAMLRLSDLVKLLQEAGYGDPDAANGPLNVASGGRAQGVAVRGMSVPQGTLHLDVEEDARGVAQGAAGHLPEQEAVQGRGRREAAPVDAAEARGGAGVGLAERVQVPRVPGVASDQAVEATPLTTLAWGAE